MIKTIAFGTLLAMAAAAANANAAETQPSPYAGQETRQIKSLSAQDIDDLRNGRGWGLAKAAELNGVPGATHLLELAEQIGLDDTQVAKLRAVKQEMTAQAKPLGEKLIALEAELDRQFASGAITDASLRDLLAQIGKTYSALRYTHLATHFKTPPLLTARQTEAYKRLRGYASGPAPVKTPATAPGDGNQHDMSGGHGH